MHKFIEVTVALIAFMAVFNTAAYGQTPCTLVNNRVALDVVSSLSGSATAVVQPAVVEFDPAPGDGRFSVDVENGTVRMFNNSNTNVLFAAPTTYTVSLAASSPVFITGIQVVINGVSGLAASNVSYASHSVTFTLTGSTWHGGDEVIVTVLTACPPCTPIGAQASLAVAANLGGNASATVRAGPVEFDPTPGDGRFSMDVENSTVRLFNNTASTAVSFPASTVYTVTIGAIPLSIVGIDVAINGVTGMAPANVTFTAQTVKFTLTGSIWPGGSNVTVTYRTACQACTLDVDGNNTVDALTDGLMLLRAMFGLTGTSVTNGAVGGGATRANWAAIRPYLNNVCGANFAP